MLRPVIEAYLAGDDLTDDQVDYFRAYLRQWIFADVWTGVDELRRQIPRLDNLAAIDRWLGEAEDLGIHPL